jgi:hypothetical protein
MDSFFSYKVYYLQLNNFMLIQYLYKIQHSNSLMKKYLKSIQNKSGNFINNNKLIGTFSYGTLAAGSFSLGAINGFCDAKGLDSSIIFDSSIYLGPLIGSAMIGYGTKISTDKKRSDEFGRKYSSKFTSKQEGAASGLLALILSGGCQLAGYGLSYFIHKD